MKHSVTCPYSSSEFSKRIFRRCSSLKPDPGLSVHVRNKLTRSVTTLVFQTYLRKTLTACAQWVYFEFEASLGTNNVRLSFVNRCHATKYLEFHSLITPQRIQRIFRKILGNLHFLLGRTNKTEDNVLKKIRLALPHSKIFFQNIVPFSQTSFSFLNGSKTVSVSCVHLNNYWIRLPLFAFSKDCMPIFRIQYVIYINKMLTYLFSVSVNGTNSQTAQQISMNLIFVRSQDAQCNACYKSVI